MRYAAFLAGALWCAPACAQFRAATVSGPEEAPAGTLVELRASSEVGAAFTWITASDTKYAEYDGGKVLVFASPNPGRYEFALITVVVTADNKPVVGIVKHVVILKGGPPGPNPPGPNPPPPPTPPDPPVPPPPVDRWGLAKLARETAPNNASEKQKVKDNLNLVAGKIAGGTYKTVEEARADLQKRNREAVGNPAIDSHPWNKFAFSVATRLDELIAAGQIQGLPGHAEAYAAIAKGLE